MVAELVALSRDKGRDAIRKLPIAATLIPAVVVNAAPVAAAAARFAPRRAENEIANLRADTGRVLSSLNGLCADARLRASAYVLLYRRAVVSAEPSRV